ncbi:uncharacterized protein G2W53_028676 [Senna tora]|uniref:Uncharacterized protein n=1 Tax=Senna tora TaxID=362788 RepID=A0A834T3Y1_9FABA|nr:uncharacterized protein G2W53_028676 [Senna tora]
MMLQLESSWHGRSLDHVLTYFGRQIGVGSQKPSRITRQKTCCASESNTSVRVVFAKRSGFDASIGVVLAWEERASCLNIFWMTNRGRVSETFTNYEAKDSLNKSQKPSRITGQKTCCASESNTSVRVLSANRSGFDAPIGVVLAWEERGKCLNIFRTTNRGQISENFTNYEAKGLLRKVVLAWKERGSCHNIFQMTNRGRISETFTNYEAKDLLRTSDLRNLHELRGKRLVAQEERGSCLNIFRTTNRGRISKTLTNYEAKDLLRKSVDHVLIYSGRKVAVGSQKPSRITRQKACCASESNTSVRVVFANRSGFDAPIGVVLAWEERGSCLNIFRQKIAVGSQKPSRIMRLKACCASESNTSVRVVFASRSGFDAPIGVVLEWEER